MENRVIATITFGLHVLGAWFVQTQTISLMTALGATCAAAATFTVSNTSDSGAGSLRQAILDADATPGNDEIIFSPLLQGTIILTSGQLSITDSLAISGPGAGKIVVSGNGVSRVF